MTNEEARAYIADYPGCCILGRVRGSEYTSVGLMARLQGKHAYTVSLKKHAAGKQLDYFYAQMDACGNNSFGD